jgi:hypothetical protein
MKRIFIIVSLAIGAVSVAGFSKMPTLMEKGAAGKLALSDTANGIHIAIPFDYCYTASTEECAPYEGKLPSMIGKVDAVWGASQPKIAPSVKTLLYLPTEVDPLDRGGSPDVTANTAYRHFLDTGHFDWLEFKGGFNSRGQRDCSIAPDVFDGGKFSRVKLNQSLAWQSFSTNSTTGHVPLDITNPGVVHYQMQYIKAALARGYNGIGIDTFLLSKEFGECGVFRRVDNAWKWTPNYPTTSSYRSAVVRWLAKVHREIKAQDRSAIIALNYDGVSLADLSLILPSVDAIFDERGVTYWGSRYPTEPEWKAIAQTIHTAQGAGKAYFLNGEVKARSDAQVSSRSVLWVLANYLLLKSHHTYTYIASLNPAPLIQRYGRFYNRPEYHIPIGHPVVHPGKSANGMYEVGASGCYARDYSGGMTYVNPSPHACTVTLARPYHKVLGHSGKSIKTSLVFGSLKIPPDCGAILLKSSITSATLVATDTATVSRSHPRGNYGSQPEVDVVNDPKHSNVKWGLFRFDSASLKGQRLINARFECTVTRGSKRPLWVYAAQSRWTASRVTWHNKPQILQKVAEVSVGTAGRVLSINLTKSVHVGATFSLALKETLTGSFACSSRHSPSPPKLIIVKN